jgi:hypothetical protein
MMKPYKFVLCLLVVFLVLLNAPRVLPAAAADSKEAVFVTLQTSTDSQIWRFVAGNPNGNMLGVSKVSTSTHAKDKPTIKVSPDGKWMMVGYRYSSDATPHAKLAYGEIGQDLKPIVPGNGVGYIFDFGFSPDSHYLTYTFLVNRWTFGIIDVESGQKTEFSGTYALGLYHFDDKVSFGNMIPNAVAWSEDSKTTYFETFVFWGCRGPHAIYSVSVVDLLNFKQGLLPATRVTAKGVNVFSYSFSPAHTHLALAYSDGDCGGSALPTTLGVIDLKTNRINELTEASAGRALRVLGWANHGQTIIFISNLPFGPDGPRFPTINPRVLKIGRTGGGIDKLTDFPSGPEEQIGSLLVHNTTVLFTVVPDVNSESEVHRLYTRPIKGSPAEAQILATSEQEISTLPCGDTLFITAVRNNKTILYSNVIGSPKLETLVEAPQIDFAGCTQ